MPAKKTPQKQSKSDFIRQQPATLSAAEVVVKGKAAGVTILPGLVYEVRRTTKVKRATAKKTSTAPRKVTTANRSSAEDFLRAVAAEVGLGRAVELLEAERARVHAVLRR